ncbi:MAG: hypothetical protein LJE65_16520 [Desulfobacteraceae bacterium]|jgi:hypothetical protein|nr:hypothetical protein [Desulfobacteraceae bacterium]
MEFLLTSTPHITVVEVALLLLLTSIANVYGKSKIALLITCFFALFWAFFINYDILFISYSDLKHSYLYFGFPFLILMLTLVGVLRREE